MNNALRMNPLKILCTVALLALAACGRHDDAPAGAPVAAASDNSAFLGSGLHAEPAASAPEPPAIPAPHADRGPPPEVPALVRDGVRYAQADPERDAGLPQASGVLVVSDDASGKRLWTLAVYNEGADAKTGADARSVFFRSMAFDADGRLRIVNESGRAYLVDLKRHLAAPVAAK
jgi:hypothetical protein